MEQLGLLAGGEGSGRAPMPDQTPGGISERPARAADSHAAFRLRRVDEMRILVRGRRLDRGGRGDPASDEARWGRTYRPENSIREGGPTEINLVASVTK